MAMAVIRMEKIKTFGDIRLMADHQLRGRPTPNADPNGDVIVILGSGDPHQDARDRLSEVPKPRKNAVLAVELIMSAGPEYFRPDDPEAWGMYDPDRVAEFVHAVRAWVVETYGRNAVSLVLHLDEGTPHIHGVIIPVLEGRLNCRELFSQRHHLRALQDSYADGLAHLGIERGKRGSTAVHTEIRHWYTDEPRRLEARAYELARQEQEAVERLEDAERIYRQLLRMVDELELLDAEIAEGVRNQMRQMFGRF